MPRPSVLALLGVAALAAAPPSNKTAVWPPEFNATMTITDADGPQFCYLSFSVANDGVYCDYTDSDPFGLVLIDIDVFPSAMGYTVYAAGGQLKCLAWPETGTLADAMPNLTAYTYDGPTTYGGARADAWLLRDASGNVLYTYWATPDAAQTPIAWNDSRAAVLQEFALVRVVPSWPDGLFREPTYVACST